MDGELDVAKSGEYPPPYSPYVYPETRFLDFHLIFFNAKPSDLAFFILFYYLPVSLN